MSSTGYVALLRGINVGGRNTVPMADLRAALVDAGHGEVRTYIQSGNVLLRSDARSSTLEADLEALLERRFGVPIVVVVRSHDELRHIVEHAPPGFGSEPEVYLSDVLFLKAPLTSEQAMEVVELRPGVDAAWPGASVVYFARSSERRSQSRLSRLVSTPAYQQMTIRNWRTTTTLLDLLDRGEGD